MIEIEYGDASLDKRIGIVKYGGGNNERNSVVIE